MKKFQIDYVVSENVKYSCGASLLRLNPNIDIKPEVLPGQFVNVLVEAPDVLLRRPISVCDYDISPGTLWLYVKNVGKGTNVICNAQPGDKFNILIPLGNQFTLPGNKSDKLLLIGGGVGIAPLLFLGKTLNTNGYNPEFLLGASADTELKLLSRFQQYGNVNVTTVDGSLGTKGFVTDHPVFHNHYDKMYCCGPTPMMKAIAASASLRSIDCEVSLENHMACGLGACLCCVQDTVRGNECVCTKGPVFNIKDLKW